MESSKSPIRRKLTTNTKLGFLNEYEVNQYSYKMMSELEKEEFQKLNLYKKLEEF